MSGPLVIGVDCSTTAAKAVVWDETGCALAEGRRGYEVRQDRPGWGEQDATAWWRATSAALADAAAQVDTARIKAISVTHQRETFVCLDENEKPLRPAMLWLDIRANAEVDEFGTEEVHRLTGKPPNPTTSWYKLLWLKRNEPRTLDRTRRVADVSSYLLRHLTGEWIMSWSSADPLGLLDLTRFDWDEGLLGAVGLDRGRLPALAEPGAIVGTLRSALAQELGLPAGLPVVAAAGDGQCAGLGCNVTRAGRAYLNLGTSAASGAHTDRYDHAKAYRTMGSAVPGAWIFETFIGGGTHNVTWFMDKLSGMASDPLDLGLSREQLMEMAAAKIPAGAEGLLCLPYWTGAMTPYWDGRARGALIGLAGVHGKAHIYRAVLEGIALEQRLLLEGVDKAAGHRIEEVLVLGGGSNSALWCQIIADALDRPVQLVQELESTALGAGMLAAAAAGVHEGILAAAEAMSTVRRTFTPEPEQTRRYDDLFAVYRGIYPALRETYRGLAGTVS